jgi:hypothetical protein
MTTTITDRMIRSTDTPHTASVRPDTYWTVTWLPKTVLTRNQALTAITLAETIATQPCEPGNPVRDAIDTWAAELGMTTTEAITLATQPPDTQ